MERLRADDLVVPHLALARPPILYDPDTYAGTHLPVGEKDDIEKRVVAVSNVRLGAKGVLSMDQAALMAFVGLSYQMEKYSPYDDTKASDIGKICEIIELAPNTSLRQECAARWESTPVMLDIALMMNDASHDWAKATRKPAVVPKPRQPPAAGSSSSFQPRAAVQKAAQAGGSARKRKVSS